MTKRYLVIILLTVELCFGMSSRPLYVTPSDDYYIVKPGDTLSAISRKSGIPVERLKLYNNLESDRIQIGQKIYYQPQIREKKRFVTERGIPKDGTHQVKKGEDLPLIARIYDLDLLKLLEYNRLSSWELEEGEIIYLAKSAPEQTKNVASVQETKPSIKENKEGSKSAAVKISPKKRKEVESGEIKKLESNPLRNFCISQRFNREKRHQGIDLAAPAGAPIYAVLDGRVVYAGVQKGYGNLVILEHSDRVMTVYAHNEKNIVETGEIIKAGEQIATVGSTGRSTGNHLHFEIRRAGQPFDPEPYLCRQGG